MKNIFKVLLILTLFISLVIISCTSVVKQKKPINFNGFKVEALGKANLEKVDGKLVVSNLRPEGEDGVKINLYDNNVYNWLIDAKNLKSAELPVGARLETKFYSNDTLLCKKRLTLIRNKDEKGWKYETTLDTGLYAIEVYSKSTELVFRGEFQNKGRSGDLIPLAFWSLCGDPKQELLEFDGHGFAIPINIYGGPPPYSQYEIGGRCFTGTVSGIIKGLSVFDSDGNFVGFVCPEGHIILCAVPSDFAPVELASDNFILNIIGRGFDKFIINKLSGKKNIHPPEAVKMKGPLSGEVGVEYTYQFTANEPNNENIGYIIDWGDGSDAYHIPPDNSAEPVIARHIWKQKGTYRIRVQAKDPNNMRSKWFIQRMAIK